MTELDKFKRRMIRSVARLVLQEKRPEEEVWEELRKETGCDCKLLWERMRALTMKKLKRLLEADDRPDVIAPVARMSLTDWLLFDLVLVHQKIDVIGREKQSQLKVEHRPLVQLFSLVQRFNICALSGERLAEAWSAATIYYNREGHQCSPMLLQRRWHQLKELTRSNFYKLWQTYRGNDRLWNSAQQFKPTPLQLAIANCFPMLILQPFPEWEELIQKRLVILPHEFEEKMRSKDLPKPCDENDPDIVLVEPVIESIDLGVDSDSDDTGQEKTDSPPHNNTPEETTKPVSLSNDENTRNIVNLAAVKKEPVEEDGLSNVKILEATHIPIEDNISTEDLTGNDTGMQDQVKTEVDYTQSQVKRPTLSAEMDQFLASTALNDDISSNPENINIEEDFTEPQVKRPTVATEIDNILASTALNNTPIEIDDDDYYEDLKPIIKEKVDKYLATKEASNVQKVITLDEDSEVKKGIKLNEENVVTDTNEDSYDSDVDDIIKQRAEEFIKKSDEKNSDMLELQIQNDINFVDDGIEFVDDGIEYVEEDDEVLKAEAKLEIEIKEECRDSTEDAAKFDLKLLMEPVVYTMKLDTMSVFKGNEFDHVNNKEIIDQVVVESKPVSKRSINVQQINEAHKNSQIKTEDVSEKSDEEYESEIEISDEQRVKATSYLLQKPRSRSYNPIQLCKNPDFNTRLKRLTVGFFSSSRNLQLLKACKPMTIDLHKAFEPKLIDGTLYLKSSGDVPQPTFVEDDQSKQTVSVIPMPIQSLLDNSVPNLNLITNRPNIITEDLTKNEDIAERNKVINLKDLSEIRRINQRLLTAEVPPLRVETIDGDPRPVSPRANVSEDIKPIAGSHSNENTITSGSVENYYERPRRNYYKIPVPRYTLQVRREPVPWNKPKRMQPHDDDFLLTVDTLNKMIHKMNGNNIFYTKNKKGDWVKNIERKISTEPTKPPEAQNDQKVIEQVKRKRGRPFRCSNDTRRVNKSATKPGPRCSRVKRTDNKKTSIVLSDEESDNAKLRNAVESIEIEHVTPEREVIKPVVRFVYNDSVSQVIDANVNISQDSHSAQISIPSLSLPNSELGTVQFVAGPTDTKEDSSKTDHSCGRGLPLNVENVTASSINPLNTVPVLSPEEFVDAAPQIRVRIHHATPQTNSVMHLPSQQSTSVINPVPPQTNSVVHTVSPQRNSLGHPLPPQSTSVIDPVPPQSISVEDSEPSQSTSVVHSVLPQITSVINPVPQQSTSIIHPALPQITSALSTPTQTAPSLQNTLPQIRAKSLKKITVWPQEAYSPKHIVIDGSKTCPIPKTVVENRSRMQKTQVRLLNNYVKKPAESPIYLGKDKILLTTVKLPKHITGKDDTVDSQIYHPKVIPTLPLPEGVSLVLMPNGHLTYTVEPDVQLDEAQLAILPTIMAAVQQQINLNKSQPTNTATIPIAGTIQNDVIKLSDDDSTPNEIRAKKSLSVSDNANITKNINKEKIHANIDISEDDNSLPIESSDSDKNVHTGIESQILSSTIDRKNETMNDLQNKTPPQTISKVDKPPGNNDTQLVDNYSKESNENTVSDKTSDVVKENQETVDSVESNSGSRNLLSDLMEMSGISAEDTRPAEPPNLMQETALPLFEIDTVAANMLQPAAVSPPLVDLHPGQTSTDNEFGNLPELSPITSLSELKYACEQNGKFFKLDFNTGIIVPINVCIKRHSKPVGKRIIRNCVPKSVIDLTDEVEYSFENAASVSKDISDVSAQKEIPGQPSNVVKPVKLFKALRSTSPIILNNMNLSQVQNPRSHKKRMRKQSFNLNNKIEAKIDLVDSDAPMEEEYLIDSSESGDESLGKHTSNSTADINFQNTTAEVCPREQVNLSYDSDDEPLAKMSRRIRNAAADDNTGDKGGEVTADPNQDQEIVEKAEGSCLVEEPMPVGSSETAMDTEPVVEGSLTEIDFMEDGTDDDDSQEDCILGF